MFCDFFFFSCSSKCEGQKINPEHLFSLCFMLCFSQHAHLCCCVDDSHIHPLKSWFIWILLNSCVFLQRNLGSAVIKQSLPSDNRARIPPIKRKEKLTIIHRTTTDRFSKGKWVYTHFFSEGNQLKWFKIKGLKSNKRLQKRRDFL